ncbi:DUF4129 domain-containing protein [Thermococcus sp.]|uniref:DUF4129 domain-containing protein n=1 Tax=Thermococcus sp. TaxID=35749 RepID=UPI00260D9F58|nr:DUF4129 domain-containing protein [Thermococcus sp.]
MSTRGRFLLLLLTVLVLLALLLNSHAFSRPHEHTPEPVGVLDAVVMAGFLGGLIMILFLFLYFRDIKGAKRRFEEENTSLFSFIALSIILILMFRFMGRSSSEGQGFTGTCARVNGTLLNCTPYMKPLGTAGAKTSIQFMSSSLYLHLYLLFLVPLLLLFAYLGFHYYRLARAELERKRKVERAMAFDRKLDELGLERFSNPKEAVVEIYKNAVLWLEGLGVPYRESWTHWEHAEHVRYMHEAFEELTRLFEKARYAPEVLGWDDAYRALEIYNRLRGKARELVEGAG